MKHISVLLLFVFIGINAFSQEKRLSFTYVPGSTVESGNDSFYSNKIRGIDFTATFIFTDTPPGSIDNSFFVLTGIPLNFACKWYDLAGSQVSKKNVCRVEFGSGLYLNFIYTNGLAIFILPTITYSGGEHISQSLFKKPLLDWVVKSVVDIDFGEINMGICYYWDTQKIVVENRSYYFQPKIELRVGFHL